MEQRTLRLGDIVDDYCPRERRITNHAIVALVENAIRQTRCTTCEFEHVFKGAREPRRRRKTDESLYEQVLSDVVGTQLVAPRAAEEPAVVAAEADTTSTGSAPSPPSTQAEDNIVPAHRILIRASLPKTDSEPPPPRPIPEFTMHQKPHALRGRGAFRRLAFGPQGDPFGRPVRGGRPVPSGHEGGRNGNSAGSGSAQDVDGGGRRGRRRRGGGQRGR